MNNNRAYHQEVMHVQRMCNARNRGVDRGMIGSEITDPNIDYAKMAQSHGRATPKGRSPIRRISVRRCERAIAVVKRGEPALVDVVTQVR